MSYNIYAFKATKGKVLLSEGHVEKPFDLADAYYNVIKKLWAADFKLNHTAIIIEGPNGFKFQYGAI